MLEKTKTIIAPVAAAAAMVGTNPNALAADAEANQTQKTVGAIATANQAERLTTVNESVEGLRNTSSTGLGETIQEVFDKSPDELSETHSKTPQQPKEGPYAYTPSPADSSPGVVAPDKAPEGPLNGDIENGLAEIGTYVEDMKLDAAEEVAFQNLALNPSEEVTTPTEDPYKPPQPVKPPADVDSTPKHPATPTPATGQNNGSASGAPAEVPAP